MTQKEQGQALKRLRPADWSATEAAYRIGISEHYLHVLESGRKPITGSVLVAIAQAYSIPFERLVRVTGFMPRGRNRRTKTRAA